MENSAIKIAHLDVETLLKKLNSALSEEWLAYYQYWVGARLMEGPMRTEIEPELLVHANEELNHATMLITRIIQLGGKPVLNPKDWFKYAECAYEAPEDPHTDKILKQNLRGERCAIHRYQDLADFTIGKDYVTYQMAVTILNDEVEHENDIESWIRDINVMREEFKKAAIMEHV